MRKRKIIWIGAGVIVGLLLLIFLAGLYFSGKIKDQIRESVTAQEEIDVDLLQQKIQIKGLEMQQSLNSFSASEVSLKGLDYWEYIINDQLVIDLLEIKSPVIVLTQSKEKQQDTGRDFKRKILIRDFKTSNGIFRLKKKDSVGNEVFVRFPEIRLSQVKIDSSTQNNALPLEFDSYYIRGDSVAVNMNPEHFMVAERFSMEDGKTSVKNFRIRPYYDRDEFDQKIPYEKDRISLEVNDIELDSLSFSFVNDSLVIKNPLLKITGADLKIYRNKLLPDDPRIKTLFNEKIRKSPVKFDLKQVKVSGSKIQYEEKVKEQGPPAKVVFTDIEGTVENLVNVNMNRKDFPRTMVDASALFMGETSVTMDWSFNATHPQNKFLISGEFATVPGDLMNPLLKPSLGVEAEGKLQSVSFTFTGNEDAAVGDVRVVYDRFKIIVMQKEGREKNKILSALANLFVDNDGVSDQRTHSVEFTRDTNKSFWNYVWKGLKKGVIEALGQL